MITDRWKDVAMQVKDNAIILQTFEEVDKELSELRQENKKLLSQVESLDSSRSNHTFFISVAFLFLISIITFFWIYDKHADWQYNFLQSQIDDQRDSVKSITSELQEQVQVIKSKNEDNYLDLEDRISSIWSDIGYIEDKMEDK